MSKYERREQKTRRRRRYLRRKMLRAFFGTLFIIASFAAVFVIVSKINDFTEKEKSFDSVVSDAENIHEDIYENIHEDIYEDIHENIQVDLGHLHSPYAVLMDFESGERIGEYQGQDKIYPASMTKIMTAILAVENTEDLGDTMTLTDSMFAKLYVAHASMAGFQPGESVRCKDLLYGVLLPSGVECCMAFAERISGSEEQFVDLMNEKAKELGMGGTHFCNSTGLHDPEHYSTVRDIAILLRYALQNETFREVFTCSRHSTDITNLHSEGITFYSTMFSSMESTAVTGGEILGGKTGYTKEAGLCLASLAKVNGREYILVTAKADGTHQTEPYHILDAVDVYSQLGDK